MNHEPAPLWRGKLIGPTDCGSVRLVSVHFYRSCRAPQSEISGLYTPDALHDHARQAPKLGRRRRGPEHMHVVFELSASEPHCLGLSSRL